jgi:hypothetical protein
MSDNGWIRPIEDQSVVLKDSGAVSTARQPDRISQADSFRDLAFAIAGMLTVALLANLLVLGL